MPVSDYGKKIRLNRILRGKRRKALIVAYDHAQFIGPIPGTEDPVSQVRRFAEAQVDGILLTLGTLKHCIDTLLTENPPAILARIDWTNYWLTTEQKRLEDLRTCLLARVGDALRHGADAVVTYLIMGTGEPEFEAKLTAQNAEVARECERMGVPLVIESLARGKNVQDPTDPQWVRLHTRIASELGADLIKTDYTGDVDTMRTVVESCGTPILALGGPKQASEEAALAVIRDVALAGAAGVIFGRNVFQAKNMEQFLRHAREVLAESAKGVGIDGSHRPVQLV
jgi:class I fructose-bisphosphate aldolase